MATIQIQNSQGSIVDALWDFIISQPKKVQQAIAERFKERSEEIKQEDNKVNDATLSSAYAFVDTIPATGGKPVPPDERAIDALIEEKYKK